MKMDKVKILLIFGLVLGLVLLIGGLSVYSYDSIRLSHQESFEYKLLMFAGIFFGTPKQFNGDVYRLSMEQLYPSSSVQSSYLLFFQIPLIIFYFGVILVGIAISLMFYRRHRKTATLKQ